MKFNINIMKSECSSGLLNKRMLGCRKKLKTGINCLWEFLGENKMQQLQFKELFVGLLDLRSWGSRHKT